MTQIAPTQSKQFKITACIRGSAAGDYAITVTTTRVGGPGMAGHGDSGAASDLAEAELVREKLIAAMQERISSRGGEVLEIDRTDPSQQ